MGNTDSIPIISQVKSLVQVMSGDVDGARRTQENFKDTAPVVSQVTSLAHTIRGENDKAKQIQKKFVKGLDDMSDGLPVVGHIKGAVYYAKGDHERGEQTMKGATGSLVSMAGGAIGSLAGPMGSAAGAALGTALFDGVVTGVDTAIHGKNKDGSPKYYGTWATYDRMGKGKASAGEIFDTVGMTAVDAIAGAVGAKLARGKDNLRKPNAKFRCRRDVEHHLTSNEAEFVTSHQRLPGSASEVLNANWQHPSVPQTVSSLVSLFIILRLILWNDKNGRTYSRELCSLTAEAEYVERCQNALMETLRRMEDHFASQKDDSSYILDPDMGSSSGITDNSTIIMIRVMTTLYGMLGSMGRGQKAGVKWLEELCLYEDLDNYRICEEEVIHKLENLNHKAFHLGEARKRRIKRGRKRCGLPSTNPSKRIKSDTYAIPKLDVDDLNSIRRSDVGTHGNVKKTNKGKNGRFESNHVPAQSSYGKGQSINSLPAHSLPYDVHQFAMRKVGTSKSSAVAKTLRGYESKLISQGKMAEAIKLDVTASYGRANVLLDTNGNTKAFRPALVEYRNDLHAVINEHRLQNKISAQDATNLHKYLENQVDYWGSKKPTWDAWFDHMESEYKGIVQQNGLTVEAGIDVPAGNRQYG